MKFSESDFFRNITLNICGSLLLETALQRSFDALKEVIPLDMIALHFYEPTLGAIRTLNVVTSTENRSMDLLTTLDERARSMFTDPAIPNVRIVNDIQTDPVVKKLGAVLKVSPRTSCLVMRLVLENQKLGSLGLSVEGIGRYTDEHARLLSLLNEPFAIAVANALSHRQVTRLKDMLSDDNRYLSRELLNMSADEIIGSDFGLRDVMEMVRKVAPLESPVLLLGETGVGKGVMAAAIHSLSPRNKGPFITVNSGAIPETLIDSELFGHEKGAFTGAVEQKRGRFERANHGTIFLDEIGELPPHAQLRMLRVLQDKEIERVGGTKAIPVDIRIIAATHRNLREMVKQKQFREDLWFRINVFPITVPPLRERKTDIPPLVYYFIKKKSRELKLPDMPELSPSALGCLNDYDWPGNVRELENVIEREMILNRTGPLAFSHLSRHEGRQHEPDEALDFQALSLDEMNVHHIRRALQKTEGRISGVSGAARLLNINPNTLRSRMKKLGIQYSKKRTPSG